MKAQGLVKFKFPFLVLVLAVAVLFCPACSSLATRQNKQLSRTVYATQAALRAGRVDLARAYNAQATRLIAPPKKRIAVKAVVSGGQKYIVLPQDYSGTPALAIGSPALTSLVAADKPLQRQLAAENRALAKVEQAADKVIAEKQAVVDKSEERAIIARHSFWGRVRFWGIGVAIAAALGALVYIFPAALPFLLGIAREVFTLLHWLWLCVASLFYKPAATPSPPNAQPETPQTPAS